MIPIIHLSAWRMTSIKTRIETIIIISIQEYNHTWRMTSIKTRIETIIKNVKYSTAEPLEEWLPLKQGLKPSVAGCETWRVLPWRMTSIKTRIETRGRSITSNSMWFLEEWLPLKQGLKLSSSYWRKTISTLEEWLPLKQRLKLFYEFHFHRQPPTLRMTSIKTRLETRHNYSLLNHKPLEEWLQFKKR